MIEHIFPQHQRDPVTQLHVQVAPAISGNAEEHRRGDTDTGQNPELVQPLRHCRQNPVDGTRLDDMVDQRSDQCRKYEGRSESDCIHQDGCKE